MTTPTATSARAPSLSHRRNAGQRTWALLGALTGLALFGCDQQESCQYRCTEVEDACPTGLSCDITLGYCVAEDYRGTCDAETHEVVVCADEPVQIELPDGVASLSELEGLPSSVELEGQTVKGRFSKKTVFAFGSPEETRHYWRVDTTSNCPTLSAGLRGPLCVGEPVDEFIQGAGGMGLLRFELVTPSEEFVLEAEGRLTGTALEPGVRSLDIAVTDARGVRKVAALELDVSDACPDVNAKLPNSCAGSDYEAVLPVLGQAPVEIADFTPIYKDGKGLNSTEAAKVSAELDAKVVVRDDKYLLEASPRSEATGSYVFGVKLENALSIEQRDIPFGVKPCAAVKADITVCEGTDFDVDLAGSDGDVWTFYDRSDPLIDHVGFVGERRLRGRLSTDSVPYLLRTRVSNPEANTQRLETLTLQVLDDSSVFCQSPSDGGTDGGDPVITSTPSHGDGGATEPPGPPSLAQGCVGEPYEFAVPTNGITQGTWVADLPDGLTIDEEGIVSGVPTEAFDGDVDVGGLRGPNLVSSAYRLTIHRWCSAVFKGVPDGSTVTRLYVADRREDVPTVEVSEALDADYEVTSFAVSPGRTHVAFAAQSTTSGESVVVIERTIALPPGESEGYFTGPIRTAPFNGLITEVNWDDADHVAFIEDANLDGGTDRNIYVFEVTKDGQAQAAQQLVARSAPDARDIVWAGDYPCLTLAHLPITNKPGSLCFDLATGDAAEGIQITINLDQYQVRNFEGRLLQVHPRGAGLPVLTSWVPFANSDNEAVLHSATFASPRADFVGTVRDTDMEVARSSDPTIYNPDDGYTDYTPLGRVADCTSVDTWQSGGWLACSLGDEDDAEVVTVGKPNATNVTVLTPFSAPGHALSGQRTFVGTDYYVFDDLLGHLNYVDLTTSPPNVAQVALPDGSHPVSLLAVADDRVLIQGLGSLWVGELSHGSPITVSEVQDAPSPAAVAEPCESAFGWTGFENWCGGDQAPRRFQVSPDGELGVYQTSGGELALFSSETERLLKTVDGIRVPCGGHPYCLTGFTITR